MAIVQTVDQHSFIVAFHEMGRGDQFSVTALRWIFDYLEEYSESTGEPVELDVIGICCEMAEMSYNEAIETYRIDVSGCETDDDKREAVIDHVGYHSTVIGYDDDSIVFVSF
jgi:hypothetical protein